MIDDIMNMEITGLVLKDKEGKNKILIMSEEVNKIFSGEDE